MPIEAPEIITKQPSEKLYIGMDFASVLNTGEIISSIQSLNVEKRGGRVSDLIIEDEIIDGSIVKFFVSGGTECYTYRVEILILTSDGQLLEGDGILEIID